MSTDAHYAAGMLGITAAAGAEPVRPCSADASEEKPRYLKIPKCPSSHHRMMKIRTVLKHPPPSFLAP